jgi:hypothetical protein
MPGGKLLWMDLRDLKRAAVDLRRMKNRVVQALRKFLYTEGLEIMAAAKKLCPVDTGALRASGFVEIPVLKGGRVVLLMGFGGPAASYAYKVHEDLTARHTVGQAKFLEVPAVARLATAHDRMSAFIDAELARAA